MTACCATAALGFLCFNFLVFGLDIIRLTLHFKREKKKKRISL
jgi:hypothetical protein